MDTRQLMSGKINWEKYGYVVASSYRTRVVLALNDQPKTPKEISRELGMYLSHVSLTLSELVKNGVALCLNPSQRRGRVFALTNEGRNIWRELCDRESKRVPK